MSSALIESLPDNTPVSRIRRLSVAGALDEGLRIVHENYRDLIRAALLIMLLPLMAAMYYGVAVLEEFWFALLAYLFNQPIDIRPYAWRFAGVALPLFFLAWRVAEPLCLGTLVALSAGVLSGQPVSTRTALRQSARCGIALIVMWSIRWAAVFVGRLMCGLPGILIAALFLCALPALVLEGTGPLRSMERSVELNGRRFWEAVLLVILLGIIDMFLMQCAQLMPRGLPQAAAWAVLSASSLVLYAAATTAFYYSGRCQLDNYDLQLWAQSVAQRDAQAAAADHSHQELYPRA